MKAYVLAAGYATRMYPLTHNVPKALLEVSGAPILTHIARRIRAVPDVSDIVVVTNARFAEQFDVWRNYEPDGVPITILNDGTSSEETRLGAVGDLHFALKEVPPGGDALVVAGDNLFDFTLDAIVGEMIQRQAPILVIRDQAPDGGPSRYNEVTLDDLHRVVRFREKPPDPATALTAIALYALTAAALAKVPEYLDGGGNPDAPGHLFAWLVEQLPVFAVPMPGPWHDVGSVPDLENARARFRA